ncbi:MAG: LTA synthase family protein [Bacilli bacterium]|jgi:lipoteichoic acid synthase
MKKIDDWKKTILKRLKKIDLKKHYKKNILFYTTVITLLINATLLRYFTVQNYLDIQPLMADLAMILLLCSFSYLVNPRKQITYFLILSVIFTTICIINSIYYTFYTSFASASLLLTSLQAKDVGNAIMKNILQLKDFIFLLQPLAVFFVYYNLSKRHYYSSPSSVERGKNSLLRTIGVSLFLYFCFFSSLTNIELSRLNSQWNREFLVMKYGLYTYQINDIIRSIEPRFHGYFGYDEVVREVSAFYEKQNVQPTKNKYTDIFKNKNIISIHAESMQTFVMDLSFHGEELTPNLNKLAKEGLFFNNFYTQVGVGTSSDSEFTFNTSLLPASSGTVFISYWDREFISIPKLLKDLNYYSFSMHGNNGTFWNRLVMHKQLGYDEFYHKKFFEIDDVIGFGLSDKSFFRQAIPMIKEITKNHERFYGTMIMLTNHTPFDQIEAYGDFPVDMEITIFNEDDDEEEVKRVPYMEGTRLGNYLKAVHYADEALGQFINDLDESGLLEDTVIVLYGDHDARLPRKDYLRLYNYDPYTDALIDKEDENYYSIDYYDYELNRKVPFLIWTKDQKINQNVDKVMGMYDVLPTLGNMFGFYSEYQLGHDIFSIEENVVVFPNGNWLTDKMYYNNQRQEYKLLEEEIINQEYIDYYSDYANEMLTISNDLIMYDYIKRETETKLLMEGLR